MKAVIPPAVAHMGGIVLLVWAAACTGLIQDQGGAGTSQPDTNPVAGADPTAGSSSQTIPFDPVSPRTYVSKVKTLLTGLGPSEAEVKQVTANPNALAELVDVWLATDVARNKLRGLWSIALQVSQQSNDDFAAMGVANTAEDLIRNFKDSMVLTTEAIAKAHQPFTEVVTTHKFMMTTAMMSFLAFSDQSGRKDSGGDICPWGCSNPFKITYRAAADGGPIPLSESLDPKHANYMTFAAPAPYSCSVPSLDASGHIILRADGGPTYLSLPYNEREYKDGNTSPALFSYLFARHIFAGGAFHVMRPQETVAVPADAPFETRGYYRTSCNDDTYMPTPPAPATDFSDWRMVTVRTPNAGETPTKFFDLPALRKQQEIALNTPRVGFLTHPAFLANCPSNGSNDARVTANQALIVALGKSIDPTDKTVVISLDGKNDLAHADPTSPCYACHRSLDPMRNIYRRNLTNNYSDQTDPANIARVAAFDFEGVKENISSLDDFAGVLARHPNFAPAWVQKVCFWANSGPCSVDDPVFIGLSERFKANKFDFLAMVKDTLTSPIVTGHASTKTTTDHGEVVSVPRLTHLCAQVKARLGLPVDLCAGMLPADVDPNLLREVASETALVAANIPTDGFTRGAENPVLPTAPNLLFRGAAEALCTAAANLAVDQKGSLFASSQPAGVWPRMRAQVMGLADGDPVAQEAEAILADHFTQATAAGASQTVAMRSALVLACLAPSALAMGL